MKGHRRFLARFGTRVPQSSFTLLEMMVTVVIVGILASVALVNYRKNVRKAEWVDAMVVLDAVYQAAQVYYLLHEEWPPNEAPAEWVWANANCNDINAYLEKIGSNGGLPLKACDKFTYDLYTGAQDVCDPSFALPEYCAIVAYRKPLSGGGVNEWGMRKLLHTGEILFNNDSAYYP